MNPDERASAEALVDANMFTIDGPIRFTFTSSSITGGPTASYQDAELDLNFQGDAVGRVETPVGEWVTVTIENAVDAFVRTFSVLIPTVRLSMGEDVQFDAVGVETTDRTLAFVGAPGPRGALQTYRVHNLHGNAQSVAF